MGPHVAWALYGVPLQIVDGCTVSCCHHEGRGTTQVLLLETNTNTVMHSAASLTGSGIKYLHSTNMKVDKGKKNILMVMIDDVNGKQSYSL